VVSKPSIRCKATAAEEFNRRNIFNISNIESLGPTQKIGPEEKF
jgi:hypothetical protein